MNHYCGSEESALMTPLRCTLLCLLARSLPQLRYTAFCAVQRGVDDPRRPSEPRSLEPFWSARGYEPRPDLKARFAWKEVGSDVPVANSMLFWLREWPP